MGIVAPSVIHTWRDAAHIDFWIKSLVAGNGEHIIACTIQLNALEPTSEFIEGVAESQGLQAQIVSLLNEAVRGDVAQVIGERTFGNEFLQHVLTSVEEVT